MKHHVSNIGNQPHKCIQQNASPTNMLFVVNITYVNSQKKQCDPANASCDAIFKRKKALDISRDCTRDILPRTDANIASEPFSNMP